MKTTWIEVKEIEPVEISASGIEKPIRTILINCDATVRIIDDGGADVDIYIEKQEEK